MALGAGAVDHVQQQVGLRHLFERGLERLDQMMRQVADEADGVGDDDIGVARQRQPSHGRVERREQLVGGVDAAPVRRLNSVDLPALV